MTTALEQQVRYAFHALAYHGFTACAHCGEHAYCCGHSPALRVCIVCFEFEFDCVAPRRSR